MTNYLLIIILYAISILGCDKIRVNPVPKGKLTLVSKYTLNIPEPSGLVFSADKKNLWTVSDNTGAIYLISLNGQVKKKLDINGKDMEGITVINSEKLAVVYEKKREVVVVDTSGNELLKRKLNVSSVSNHGLEGIAYNPKKNIYYAVNEKSPELLIKLDENFNKLETKEMNFSDDLSDISYEENENVYWVLSDESHMLFKFDENFNLLTEYEIPLKQPEGVAVDFKNKLIYVVSDKDAQLAVFKIK